jgi:hypothetical protein
VRYEWKEWLLVGRAGPQEGVGCIDRLLCGQRPHCRFRGLGLVRHTK